MDEKTRLIHLGRDPKANHGIVNPPVYHASTVLFNNVDDLRNRRLQDGKPIVYGLHGTPTTHALEEAIADIEGGYDAVLSGSGLASIFLALMAYLKAGDHLLMLDAVYGPTRRFCDNVLNRFGIETTYYDPLIGAGIADLIRPETAVVFVESPASNSFEIQDIPAISQAAKEASDGRVKIIMDNTWASPLFFKPFKKGVDVSIQAGTKYISGHSDVMLGSVTATAEAWPKLKEASRDFGLNAAPDDVYLALRGLRTMAVRLEAHQKATLEITRWLQSRPQVARVLYPALPEDPGHEIWKRDFEGASGLFGLVLRDCSEEAVITLLDNMKLFKMGYSWGGFESLILPTDLNEGRVATTCQLEGPTLRIHIGLESVEDLKADLTAGLELLG